MSEPLIRIPGVRQQYHAVDDPDQTTLVSTIAVDLSYAEVWALTRAGVARYIGRSTPGVIGKVDSAGVRSFADGTVRLYCAAADVGMGGATSHTVWFDFPGQLARLDYHGKELIYNRVTTADGTSGTHNAIVQMIDMAIAEALL